MSARTEALAQLAAVPADGPVSIVRTPGGSLLVRANDAEGQRVLDAVRAETAEGVAIYDAIERLRAHLDCEALEPSSGGARLAAAARAVVDALIRDFIAPN